MRRPSYTTHFQKDFKKAVKRGKDLDKLQAVSRILIAGEPLEARFPHEIAKR